MYKRFVYLFFFPSISFYRCADIHQHVDFSDQTVFCSQESTKVSDLNPNAKAWANHMFSLDPSGSADTTTAALQPWKEGCDSSADPGPEGQSAIRDTKYTDH